MPEEPLSRLDSADQSAMIRPDAGRVTIVSWKAEVSAVLPSPQATEAYERSINNAGERLLRLVESESAHRHELEKKIVSSDLFRANLGLIAGIMMAVGVSSASLAAIFQGKQIGGVAGIGATAALIGGTFRVRKTSSWPLI
jgi:uncharacterized membrane protein